MRITGGLLGLFGIIFPAVAFSQTSGTYYDSFYSDYTKSYPDSKPPAAAPRPQAPAASPMYVQPRAAQVSADRNAGLTSYYNTSGHTPGVWELEGRYKMSEGQFFFETDVGSILNWDEAYSSEFEFKASRDFMLKNRQYVFSAGFSTGSLKTSRTSDDDIFNELHIISLGSGSASLSSWNVGVGIRNWGKVAGFDVTPSVGWKNKSQKFEMADHVAPAPFYFDEMCFPDEYGLCDDIYLNDPAISWLLDYVYLVDKNGNEYRPSNAAEWDDVSAIYAISLNGTVNLSHNMLVPDEDFCWVTDGGRTACLMEYDIEGYNNVSYLFGGVSSLNDQRGLTTHKYYVTWAGPYIGLSLERALSQKETLLLYGELFKPVYRAEGDWPLRTDWMHDPSFIDDGGSAWGFMAELEYKYKFAARAEFTVGLSREWIKETMADTTLYFADDYGQPAGTGFYSDAIYTARWKNTSIFAGITFKL
jgi:hypothetical protein